MKFEFVRFTETGSSFAARVTVRQTGQFGFNSGAINSFNISGYEFCVLYFDPKQRVVGIELPHEKCEAAIPIRKSESNTYIRAKNFCDRYAIDYSKSYRYDLKKDASTGYLYFEVSKQKTDQNDENRELAEESNLK